MSAVDFLSNLLRTHQVDDYQIETFRQTLHVLLCTHYQNHWFPEKPMKGSAYRCLRINGHMDPLLRKAGETCGLSEGNLYSLLPRELTLWVDPQEVSYRIGEDGSIGVLYNAAETQENLSVQSSELDLEFQQPCSGEARLMTPSFRPDAVHMEYLAQYAS